MKIISWNVNGLRAVHKKGLFVPFVKKYQPDIICLKETKAEQGQAELRGNLPLSNKSARHFFRLSRLFEHLYARQCALQEILQHSAAARRKKSEFFLRDSTGFYRCDRDRKST